MRILFIVMAVLALSGCSDNVTITSNNLPETRVREGLASVYVCRGGVLFMGSRYVLSQVIGTDGRIVTCRSD